jgi:mutator protein MutT
MGPEKAVQVAVAVLRHEGALLIGQRPPGVPLAGLWEFPGGKVRPGETPAQAAARECREETGLEALIEGEYPAVEYAYDFGRLELRFFAARPRSAETAPRPPFRWVPAAHLADYPFPPANAALLKLLQQEFHA